MGPDFIRGIDGTYAMRSAKNDRLPRKDSDGVFHQIDWSAHALFEQRHPVQNAAGPRWPQGKTINKPSMKYI